MRCNFAVEGRQAFLRYALELGLKANYIVEEVGTWEQDE